MESHSKRALVFQILRLLVWTVIAVALVKFAFFPNQKEEEEIVGQGKFELPTISVERGDIENSISLEANVVRDESSTTKSSSAGEVVWFYVEDGDTVGEGAPILQVKKTESIDSGDPEGEPATSATYHDIYASASGTIKFSVLLGQQVAIGDGVGTITPTTFHAQVAITPDKLYSLASLPDEATLAIKDGPAPFGCTNLRTITPTPADNNSGEGANASNGPQLRCDIPGDQTVYDGLKATLDIAGGSATDALIVPVSAVEGRFREGNVYLPGENASSKPEKKTVKLGVSDGKYIEITEGLSEGESILEFVPRKAQDDQDGNGGDNMMSDEQGEG